MLCRCTSTTRFHRTIRFFGIRFAIRAEAFDFEAFVFDFEAFVFAAFEAFVLDVALLLMEAFVFAAFAFGFDLLGFDSAFLFGFNVVWLGFGFSMFSFAGHIVLLLSSSIK